MPMNYRGGRGPSQKGTSPYSPSVPVTPVVDPNTNWGAWYSPTGATNLPDNPSRGGIAGLALNGLLASQGMAGGNQLWGSPTAQGQINQQSTQGNPNQIPQGLLSQLAYGMSGVGGSQAPKSGGVGTRQRVSPLSVSGGQ